jgi:translation initiation factor 3 subunit I|uniref:Eukaryotic translation initiation factor 3 subunit I n=1 Tax=Prasinoderma singulare TaxID=676789 RepID=A0A7S3F8R4_9VIRI|mmetsp:Transcript_13810/g.43332  ORF Transcript_13810/g.43332 Transcript_13810/m.43332 type:complete len:358 (+) Transcript_13810:79-1152(+)|eukprot:CAMPEP_0119183762 /NCGR_PEP_ID=MMETSP1315-20130426/64918_1 /TAXON_ID=676789 /ORGANISM="Prasinoderma singularis, Strain RCC927" /LENGTH=357 /DNA_ID=CAMNT_0007178151 /DNA_START=36 /DNA_END=1109 /DNA_ORIENTATION=+
MRPLLLSSHSRPITQVKYNREGDILITTAKDHYPGVWYSDDGRRIGTLEHNGTVWSCDINQDSTRIVTASADCKVKIWDLDKEPGKEIFTFECFNTPCRYIEYACGDKQALLTTDPFMQQSSAIHILNFTDDVADQHTQAEPAVSVEGKLEGRISRATWGDCNETFVTCGEDGYLRTWDTEKMEIIKEVKAHGKHIGDLRWSHDKTHFITASIDKTAKLWDARTLTHLKTYENSAPVNSAAISPLMEHIMLGGGQDASQVTTTSHKSGKFESKFYHKIFEEEFGRVAGHFGPINTMCFHPNGRSFTTGGEDGYVRIHHFDPDYFNTDSWFGTTKLRKMYEDKYGERADWHKGEKAAA